MRGRGRGQRKGPRVPLDSRTPIPIGTINDSFINFYRAILIPSQLSEAEFDSMLSFFRTPLPHVFRLSSISSHIGQVSRELSSFMAELQSAGVDAVELPELPPEHGRVYRISIDKAQLRREEKFQKFRQWLTVQTQFGQCHRQEFVSMIPPYFLFVEQGHVVLDTCAAPGSKTAQIVEMLNGEGCVVANDSDPKRCHSLVHQLQRVGTTNVLVVCDNAQGIEFQGSLFDRVLCDVPCSGDGTLRKNAIAGAEWHPKRGGGLHGVQRAILKRGLELLKEGGIAVYSTCSMNPLENEAVVNSVLLELDGAAEVVDCSERLPLLKRHPGLTDWKVFDIGLTELTEYASFEAVPMDRRGFANTTFFPQPQVPGLQHCMRFYPQDADGGAFFVTAIRKVREFPRLSKPPTKHPRKLREAPYLPISTVSAEVLAEVQAVFGFQDAFPTDQLFVRDEQSVRNISFIARPISEWFHQSGSEVFRTISCGCPIFVWRGFGSGRAAVPYAAQPGLPIVMRYATKRVFKVTPAEMHLLLKAGHQAVAHHDLSPETFEQFRNDEPTGCIIHIPETLFAYPGMTFKSSICVYLRKDLLPVETHKLEVEFPELGTGDPPALPNEEEEAPPEGDD
jgi:16S rRNA C967 or C1407 C5-methylase (RsmB/RsmF family)